MKMFLDEFKMLLYNYYLVETEIKSVPIYRAGSNDRELFIKGAATDVPLKRVRERYFIIYRLCIRQR